MTKKFISKKGVSPSTPIYIGVNPPVETEVVLSIYDEEEVSIYTVHSTNEITQLLAKNQHANVWVQVKGLKNIRLISDIGRLFKVHPLVIEDVLNTNQRPKLDVYGDYVFSVLKMHRDVSPEDTRDELIQFKQFSIITEKSTLLTFQEEHSDIFEYIHKRLTSGQSRLQKQSVDFLAYALVDIVIDDFILATEKTGEKIEDLEDDLIDTHKNLSLKELYMLKRQLIQLRKVIQPIRDVVSMMIKEELVTSSGINFYLRDLYDHCLRILDSIDTYRDMTSSILDIYMSTVNNRMNETIKFLTIFSTIFIPLTFVTGFYGMNFRYIPGLTWRGSFFIIVAVMLLMAGTLLLFFRKKRWL